MAGIRQCLIIIVLTSVSHLICIRAEFQNNFFFYDTSLEEIQFKLKTDDVKISENCVHQMELYINKLKRSLEIGKLYENNWAWQMFDSSGKISSGILTGNVVDLGNMDECLAIDTIEEGSRIQGKYCYMGINVPIGLLNKNYAYKKNNLTKVSTGRPDLYSVSICLPDSCSPSELSELIIGIPDAGVDFACQTTDINGEFDGYDWTFIIFIIIIAILAISSTTYDLYLNQNEIKESPAHPILLAFSFYTNGKKIFQTTNNSSPNQLSSLNGLRVFSILWVMAGHRYSGSASIPNLNSLDAIEWSKKPYSQYVQGAPLAVDSFFFMSGVVMAYTFIKSQSKPNARFNVFMFYLHRYLRLTPALAVTWLYYISVIKRSASGPFWPVIVNREQNLCREYWYSLFLYFQNYMNAETMCMNHSWYLSIDMQFFLISPIILIPLVKYPKYSFYFLIGLIMVSVIPPIVIVNHYKLILNSSDYGTKYYVQPYNRISPWLVGILLGAILVKFQDRKIIIKKWLNLCIWCTILTLMGLNLFLGNEVNNGDKTLDFAFYTGLHRMFWAVGLMWIVFACHHGYGGFINSLLSMPIFQVIARLTYSMYLIHMPLMMISVFRKRTAQVWDDYEVISQSLGDIIPVTFVALIWCLLFESPMVVIEKFLFGNRKEKITLGTKADVDAGQ